MSWIQWQGEVLPVTPDEGELRLHLAAPDSARSRQWYDVEVFHTLAHADAKTGKTDFVHWLSVDIPYLPLAPDDWRRCAEVEIRADAAWQERNEQFDEFGHLCRSLVEVSLFEGPLAADVAEDAEEKGEIKHWVGHDFVLRFGKRDGLSFPFELDAWLLPRDQFDRQEPESPEELSQFGVGKPNLRVISKIYFSGGTVALPRLGLDPIPVARRRLLEEASCSDFLEPSIEWSMAHTPDRKQIIEQPGWRSNVHFSTGSGD